MQHDQRPSEFPNWYAHYMPAVSEEYESKLVESRSLAFFLMIYFVLFIGVIAIAKYSITGSVF